MNQTNENNELRAAQIFHPGELLIEELDERQLTQAEFSQIIGRPPRTINEIIKGKRSITPETAGAIAAAFGTSPDYWLALQAEYDLFVLNKKNQEKDQEVRGRSNLYSQFPISDLVRRKYIKAKKRVVDLQNQIESLFGEELKSLSITGGVFLRASEGDINKKYLDAWVALGKKLAKDIRLTKSYDKEGLSSYSSELKKSSIEGQVGIENVISSLNGFGVRVIILPHFSKTRADGAVFWLDDRKPVIMLSMRYDRIDNFYFTLLHEIGHILLHKDQVKEYFTDNDIYAPNNDTCEIDANAFASKNIGFGDISEKLRNKKINSLTIQRYSQEFGVHPGLLVGHLQHTGALNYTNYRKALINIKGKLPKEIVFR